VENEKLKDFVVVRNPLTIPSHNLNLKACFYPSGFSSSKIMKIDIYFCEQCYNFGGISDHSRMLVETRKHTVYTMVYLLLKLELLLHVENATVERSFSFMSFVKNMRNHMKDEFLNNCLVTCI